MCVCVCVVSKTTIIVTQFLTLIGQIFSPELMLIIALSVSHREVMISRPASNRAVIRYAPSTQDQLNASDEGLKGLFVVRYDVNRELDGGDLLVGTIPSMKHELQSCELPIVLY